MLLSALSKTLSTFLVLVLVGMAMAFTADSTVFNNEYVEQKLTETNSYQRLSVALNQEIANKASQENNADTAAMTAKLQEILTPAVLEQKITQAIDGFHAYYRGNGPLPTIDLTDIAAQAKANGIPIPEDSEINKPITFGSNAQLKDASKTFNGIRQSSIVVAVLLAGSILVLSWKRGKWGALPNTAIASGVLVGLLTLVFWLTSRATVNAQTVGKDAAANAFAAIGRDLAASITHDFAARLGIIAAVLLVSGIVSRILVARLHPQSAIVPIGVAPKPVRKPATPTFVK